MISLIKRVHAHWMQLDPPHQFMFWTVCGVIFSGILLLTFAMLVPNIMGEYVPYVVLGMCVGIMLLCGLFVTAIIYLTVIWPHRYQHFIKKDNPPKTLL